MTQRILLIFLLCFLFQGQTRTAEQWKTRSIYQLLTDRFARNDGQKAECSNLSKYCGGGFKGIQNNLQYISGMGFDAIWISPVVDNRDEGYHGYWARDLYKINSHFGTEQDLKDLVKACHERNIWVMVDVVANHMGNTNENYTLNVPFNNSEHYHTYCTISGSDFKTYNQQRIENCRLAKLADLKQESSYVRETLLNWIKNLVSQYSIDGLRIDTVPEVPKWFWSSFSKASRVFTIGEVFDGNMAYVAGYSGSLNACLNYPFFFWVRDTLFNKKDMKNLRTYYSEWAKTLSSSHLQYFGNFVDNHDNPRTLSWTGDWGEKVKHYKSTHVIALTSIGIPIVYYGAEQLFTGGNDPHNREILWNNLNKKSQMYQYLKKINIARKKMQVWNHSQVERYVDTEIFVYSRGKLFVAVTNKVSGTVEKEITYHPFSNGETICNIFYPTTDCIKVSGSFKVYLLNGESKIYIPK